MNARIAKKVARHRNRYSEEQERLARRKLRRKPLWRPRLAFLSLRMPRFKIPRNPQPLSAYEMPITRIIEENSLKDLVTPDEHRFLSGYVENTPLETNWE